MTKGEIIKSWIPYELVIPEEENPNDPMFVPIYLNTYNIGYDDIDARFVIQSKYTLDLKSGKLKVYPVADKIDRFPFHPYSHTEYLVSEVFDIIIDSQSDNFYKDSKSGKMILNAAAILEKTDITPETTYTDAIHIKMIASSDENGEICLFSDCKATINLYRIFSSMPEDLINAKCSEAYDKMKDIQKEMKNNLDESLVYKFEQDEKEGAKERVVFVDSMLISLRDMYKSIEALDAYYRKENQDD